MSATITPCDKSGTASKRSQTDSLWRVLPSTQPFCLNKSLTNAQAYAIYWLLRGGIEDRVAIAEITLADYANLPTEGGLNRLYLHFDNLIKRYPAAFCKLPYTYTEPSGRRELNRARVVCRKCNNYLLQLPCPQGCRPVAYALNKDWALSPAEPQGWIDRDDRHWANLQGAELADSRYHGGGYSEDW